MVAAYKGVSTEARAMRLLSLAAEGGFGAMRHVFTKRDAMGTVISENSILQGIYTMGNLQQSDNYSFLTTTRRQYLVSPQFSDSEWLTPMESRVISNLDNCTIFYRLARGRYFIVNGGNIGCFKENGVAFNFTVKEGRTFEIEESDSCASTCLQIGLRTFPRTFRFLDPIPAYYPGLVRPMRTQTPYRASGKNEEIEKTDLRIHELLAESVRQVGELAIGTQTDFEQNSHVPALAISGVVIAGGGGLIALALYIYTRWRRSRRNPESGWCTVKKK
jgi:hypothetical protein